MTIAHNDDVRRLQAVSAMQTQTAGGIHRNSIGIMKFIFTAVFKSFIVRCVQTCKIETKRNKLRTLVVRNRNEMNE